HLPLSRQREGREVPKLANRGQLPGRKVGGEWRSARTEINHWLEQQLPGYDDRQLTALESSGSAPAPEGEPVLSIMLSEACMAVPLRASTKASALRQLVQLADQSFQVFDSAAVLTAVQQREEMASTPLAG